MFVCMPKLEFPPTNCQVNNDFKIDANSLWKRLVFIQKLRSKTYSIGCKLYVYTIYEIANILWISEPSTEKNNNNKKIILLACRQRQMWYSYHHVYYMTCNLKPYLRTLNILQIIVSHEITGKKIVVVIVCWLKIKCMQLWRSVCWEPLQTLQKKEDRYNNKYSFINVQCTLTVSNN